MIFEQKWYQVAGIELHQYHLPLLSALSFNAECDLLEEDLEAFWDSLTGGDTSVPIVSFVANWLSNHINEKTTLKTIVTSIEDIAKRSKTKKWVRFDEQKRLKRFLNSLKRFVVPRSLFCHRLIPCCRQYRMVKGNVKNSLCLYLIIFIFLKFENLHQEACS